MTEIEQAKKTAAEAATEYVDDGMIVGLGTGSTAFFAIQSLGKKSRSGQLRIKGGVPTSVATADLAEQCGIPLLTEFSCIDITIDGADEVDPEGNLLKGGGGALTREKIVAAASTLEIIIVDELKQVQQLGRFPLPVEVVPFGWKYVSERLAKLGCKVSLRRQNGHAFQTDNGNLVLDCSFARIAEPAKLALEINAIPGVVENGLFVGLADLVIVGSKEGGISELRFRKGN